MARRCLIAFLAFCFASCGTGVESPPRTADALALEATYRAAARLRGAALAAMDAADWNSAIELLEELESTLPDNLIGPLNLAVCHLQTGDVEIAQRAAERARRLAPDNPQLLYALARIEAALGDYALWQNTLDHFVAVHPRDPRPHFLRLRALEERGEGKEAYRAADDAVRRDFENLVLLVDRLAVAAQAGLAHETEAALDAVEDRLGGFDEQLSDHAEALRVALIAPGTEGLYPRALVIRNILRPSELYRQQLIPLAGPESTRGTFAQLDFEPPLPKFIQGGRDIEIAFVEASGAVGSPRSTGSRSQLRVDAAADRDTLLADTSSGLIRLTLDEGVWRSELAVDIAADRVWSTLDLDQDGLPDLLAEHDGNLVLSSNGGSLSPPIAEANATILGVYPVDFDLEGDLDLVVTTAAAARYWRNNGDGTWLEETLSLAQLGPGRVTDLRSADFDDDGDLDLVVATDVGLRLLSNPRLGALVDVSASWGLDARSPRGARLEVEDFDADGLFDVLAWNEERVVLLTNTGRGFEFSPLLEGSTDPRQALTVADFDNDGDRDLVTISRGGAVLLLRNLRPGFRAEELDVDASGITSLVSGDFDGDGDLDLVASGESGSRYWRNDGGSLNHWLRLRLNGLTENNSKNNSQGLFVRIESRIGGDYQALLGNGSVNHIGLGAARQVDALRVVWTNGLGQTWAALAADQNLDEQQVLKGSCPFLYTWNGERFEFVTDLMWKSPLGMVMADGSAAPHQSAQDWVLIPGERLKAADGELWLQVTEELWETIYLDRQKLLAVDHPARVDLMVDEKFTMPPHPTEPPMHWLEKRLSPIAARDQRGRDVLPEILFRDGLYVGGLPLSRYQGVTTGHELELKFTDVPERERLRLVLHGWIFPTDTSINLALSQGRFPAPSPPRLDLATASGWQTLSPSIGFPSGKRKAVIVELTDLLPAGDVTLRLTTDMQIYWNSAALAVGEPEFAPRITVLEPAASDLHYRGFSRLYRDGDTSPHLFDYADVSTAPRFRDLAGRYTRFGPVGELLRETDDRYVVMNAGDELTVRFAVAALPPLPPDWQRDYVLFTDGWVKDGDIHTARSQTVEPLPFHAMEAYPSTRLRFPDTSSHKLWLGEYQTRWVDDEPFRSLAAVRPPFQ